MKKLNSSSLRTLVGAKFREVHQENGIKTKIKTHLEVNGVKIMQVVLLQIGITAVVLLGAGLQQKLSILLKINSNNNSLIVDLPK